MHKVGIKKAEYRPKNNNKEEGTKFVRNSISEIEDKLCSNNNLKKSLLSENKEFKFNFLLKKKMSHMKCFFNECTSTSLDRDLQWVSVLKDPKEST